MEYSGGQDVAPETVVDKTTATMGHLNTFGINIGEQPLTILMDACVFQLLESFWRDHSDHGRSGLIYSRKPMQQQQTTTIDPDNPMARSMNSMNYIMPLFPLL